MPRKTSASQKRVRSNAAKAMRLRWSRKISLKAAWAIVKKGRSDAKKKSGKGRKGSKH